MSLPKRFMNLASGIEHQRSSNWCTNHAVSSLVESMFGRVHGKIETLSNSWGMMLSKKVDGRPSQSGTTIESIMDQVCKYGMCTESLYPTWEDKDYHDNKFLPTTQNMYDVATQYKPKKRVDIDVTDIEAIKHRIVHNSGCVVIVRVYNEHISPVNGFVVKPEKGTEPSGTHAIWACGYIEDMPKTIKGQTYRNWIILQESYGATRGFKGYLFVPYEAFINNSDWVGHYSVDRYVKSVHAFDIEPEKIKYPTFHNNTLPLFPMKKIELKVGSTTAIVDGVKLKISQPPIIENSITMVPFKFLCTNLGYSVNYKPDIKEITAFDRNRNQLITMKVGSPFIVSSQNGITTTIESDVPVKVISGSTVIPLRLVSELTGATVDFTHLTKEILITQ